MRSVVDDIEVTRSVWDYTETDVAEAVQNALHWASDVPPGIHSELHTGVVTLTGEVQWNHQRRAAQRAIERVTGVDSVDNRITLARRPSAPDTRERIQHALVRNAILDANAIDVRGRRHHDHPARQRPHLAREVAGLAHRVGVPARHRGGQPPDRRGGLIMQTIVVGIDTELPSRVALDWVIERTALIPARVRLVTVIGDRPFSTKRAQRDLAAARRRLTSARSGMPVETKLLDGVGIAEVLAQESADADLLVVGHHRNRILRSLAAGALPTQIAMHATCPVVVVPHDWLRRFGKCVVGVQFDGSARRRLVRGHRSERRRA